MRAYQVSVLIINKIAMLMKIGAAVCLLSLLTACAAPRVDAEQAAGCKAQVARWVDPASGKQVDGRELLARISGPGIVLLGESHTTAADHRWQLYMLTALHSRYPDMVVGFEMFPRAVQPVLDAWSAGELREDEFLERSRWDDVWGYDAGYYLPLLHFVRQHRLTALALNVDRDLISRIADQGWQAVAEDEREGVSDPAPASAAYRESLARLYAYKRSLKSATSEHGETSAEDLQEIMNEEGFKRFVEAQTTWDRAMAEALAGARRSNPSALAIGIAGRGHIEHGFGIPYQLADLGIDDVEVLLPIDAASNCADLAADIAGAVFLVDRSGEARIPPHARLGVMIENGDDGVRVTEVLDDTVAEASGIEDGDVIQAAAGFDTRTTGELVEVIQRQAPGTWLPLKIRRGDEILEITARFPQSFE
jgi:uncharacterized iron-regulated protein